MMRRRHAPTRNALAALPAQVARIVRSDGVGEVRARAARRLLGRLEGRPECLPVFTDDLLADPVPEGGGPAEHGPLVVNWVMTPPSRGSGGHTTIFRVLHQVEDLGHTCNVLLYDRYLADERRHRDVIEQHFGGVNGVVADVRRSPPPGDAVVATSWETAYPVVRTPEQGRRLYFVQDFEPWFHAAGSLSVLAENTYGLGMRGVTVGPWLSRKLSAEYGMTCDHIPFGHDPDVYNVVTGAERDGVGFFARPVTARRGYDLGILALQHFATRHPDVPIHVFGRAVTSLPFRHVAHGLLSPAELNALYNRCAAVLVLSMSNVSLVPLEVLAAGAVPVMNDAGPSRSTLDNPHVVYAAPRPRDLAEALGVVVTRAGVGATPDEVAASVGRHRWDGAGATFVAAIRERPGRDVAMPRERQVAANGEVRGWTS